jgi:hypothetical protein
VVNFMIIGIGICMGIKMNQSHFAVVLIMSSKQGQVFY